MTTSSKRSPFKRIVASVVASTVVLQPMAPAYAVVSQNPSVFVSQPDSNIMFTLDDSGSMTSDSMPDNARCIVGLPNSSSLGDSTNCGTRDQGGYGSQFPSMWKNNSGYLARAYYQTTNRFARYLRSSAGNPIYYDPKVRYRPWPLATDDQSFNADADATRVNIHVSDPFNTGRRVDLTARVNFTGSPDRDRAPDNENDNFWPATYFVYDNPGVVMPLGNPEANATYNPDYGTTNSQGRQVWRKVEIKPTTNGASGGTASTYTKYPDRTDCTGTVCTYQQELQNFANWLQYYRSRYLMAKGGVAAAFAKLNRTDIRVGFASINQGIRLGVRPFSGTNREAFYNALYTEGGTDGTPLRLAMDRVGRYFQTNDVNNPWAFLPGTTLRPEYDCRRSFHIMSTDGYWNGDGATGDATTGPAGDNDTFAGGFTPYKPDGVTRYAYTDNPPDSSDPLVSRFQVNPFRDAAGTNQSNRLSDVSAYFWKNDLRTDIANNVSSSARDPAFWQHLQTFTVGLGIFGSGTARRHPDGSTVIPAAEAASTSSSPFRQADGVRRPWLETEALREALIANKTQIDWPDVSADGPTTGDDLVRSAMVGRGRFLSATNPTALADGLGGALAEAINVPLSLANLAPSSGTISAGSEVYQATYNAAQWYGRLYAFNQATSGIINTNPESARWEASHRMPAPDARNIFTWNGSTNLPASFLWGNLSAAQRTSLNNDSRLVDYLRGSPNDEERNGGPFRDRSRYTTRNTTGGILGDIVNGSPIRPSEVGAGYLRLPAGTPGQLSYATYRSPASTSLNNLLNTIFVGANDGMLHAFNREDGVERFGYVPNSVYNVPRGITGTDENKLRLLSSPTYAHRFTVDGPPQVSDVFFGETDATGRWRTVMSGSTGAGARSVFLMDVTNPQVGAGGFGPANVLWEFSEANNVDMGYMLTYGHVARMKNGKWALILGNGYDSSRRQAKLFILDLATGAVIREIAVGPIGGDGIGVGRATPAGSNIGNGLSQPNFTLKDRMAEYIYAGDLYGNLWKFDVTSADPAQWRPSFGSAPQYAPLYKTPDNNPITVMPTIGFLHPNGGVMLNFGTGKSFEVEDSASGNTNVNRASRQTIYGIWDKPSQTAGFSGLSLLREQVDGTTLGAAANTALTGTSGTAPDWATQRGWYIRLRATGERVNVRPQIPDPANPDSPVFVVANTPAEAVPCQSGGTARIFALNVYSGLPPANGTFDANNDNRFTTVDRGYNVFSINTGVLTLPLFQTLGGGGGGTTPSPSVDTAFGWDDGKSGTADGGREDPPPGSPKGPCGGVMSVGVSDTSTVALQFNQCGAQRGRISWRQIQ